MKRLLAIVLSLMVITTTASSLVFAEDTSIEYADVKTEEFKAQHRDVFIGMGLASEEYVNENLYEPVTRGDFALMLARLLTYNEGIEEITATKKIFSDVDIYHYAAGGVQLLVEREIVSGCGDGTFCVDRTVTAEEIAIMVARILGYGALTQEMQGESIIKTATANIRGRYTGELNLEECFEVLYNALFENTITLNRITDAGIEYTEGDIFLRKILELDYMDGVLQAVGNKALYKTETNDEEIIVDGYKFSCDSNISEDLLGFKVRVFYSEDRDLDYKAVAVECLNNEVLTIDVRAFEEYSDNTLKYYDMSNRLRKVKTISKKDILYNYIAVNDIEKYIPQYGKIKLIDNGSSDEYDVVMIFGYDSAVVSRLSANDGIIQFKNHTAIDISEYDNVDIVDTYGNKLEVSDLGEGNVVSIYTYEKEYARLEVSTVTMTGKIDTIRDDYEGWKKFVVDGGEYFAYSGFASNGIDFRPGQTVTLLLDIHGKIAGISTSGTSEWKIGYIMEVKLYDDDYECLQFKLLNQEGYIEKIQTTAEIRLDEEKREPAQALERLNIVYQEFQDVGRDKEENVTTRIMRYFVNDDGRITKIDTPIKTSLLETEGVRISENNKLLMRVKGRLHRPENGYGYKIDSPGRVSLMGEVTANTNNIAFIVPTEENSDPDETEDYQVTTMESLKAALGGNYYLSAYNYDPTSLKTDILVIRRSTGTTAESNMMIVDGVRSIYNPETSEVKTEITGLVNAARVTYNVNERSSTVNVNTIEVGDIYSYKTQNNEAVLIDLLWRENGAGKLKEPGIFAEDGTLHYYSPFRVLMGEIMRIDGDKALLNLGESTFVSDLFTLPSSVIVYGGSSKAEPCYVADRSTILTQQGGKGDTVIVAQGKRGGVKSIIVIK